MKNIMFWVKLKNWKKNFSINASKDFFAFEAYWGLTECRISPLCRSNPEIELLVFSLLIFKAISQEKKITFFFVKKKVCHFSSRWHPSWMVFLLKYAQTSKLYFSDPTFFYFPILYILLHFFSFCVKPTLIIFKAYIYPFKKESFSEILF